ncbi:hypothetical protein LTR62_001624 [Meristemomyces frigidus]|uniref:Ureidoglycolate hydrolase n=1 Tax=Meristemomyces frigidus TaxID=1508187 RepID=A0AAN7T8B3_9PEZI|nr:hypothetical protein LTR62_001624 [Meristemomyces frigidus]
MATRLSPSSRTIRIELLSPASFSPFGEVIQNPAKNDGAPRLESSVANQGSAKKWLDVTKMQNWYELGSSKRPAKVVMNMFVCKPRQLDIRDGRNVFSVRILERHPFTPQTFVPMGLGGRDEMTCYMVIVAPTLPLRSGKESKAETPTPAYPVPTPLRKRSLKDRLLGTRPNPFTNDFSARTTPTVEWSHAPRPKGAGLPDLDNIRAFIARGDQAVTYGAGTWHAPMVVLGKQEIDFVVVQYANGVANEDCQEVMLDGDTGQDGVAVEVDRFFEQDWLRARL